MLEHSRKKFKSAQKEVINNQSRYNLQKTSPSHKNFDDTSESKSFKRLQGVSGSAQQECQTPLKFKHFSFLKFMPTPTKHKSEKAEEGHKQAMQIRVPSFFKKGQQAKQISFTSLSLKPKQEKQSTKQRTSIENSLNILKETHKSSSQVQAQNSELNDYSKLSNKIDYLMRKIKQTQVVVDKRRQEKLTFMEQDKIQRAHMISNDEHASTSSASQTPMKQFITQVSQQKDLHSLTKNPYSHKNSIYYVSQVLRTYREEDSLTRQHLLSSIQYLRMFHHSKIPQEREIEHLKVNLPRLKGYEDKKTIIFDLDETLIHCNENMFTLSDFKIKVNFPTGEIIQVGINVRPFAREILATLSRKFQIIVFTASHHCYANVVLDHLDPQKKHIHHRLFRESCYCTSEGVYVKDLRIINRSLDKMILIDNAAYSYAHQPLNGVPIVPYYEGKNDYELQALLKYIQGLNFSMDVREKNKKAFKLDRYHQFEDLHSLVQTLYASSHH